MAAADKWAEQSRGQEPNAEFGHCCVGDQLEDRIVDTSKPQIGRHNHPCPCEPLAPIGMWQKVEAREIFRRVQAAGPDERWCKHRGYVHRHERILAEAIPPAASGANSDVERRRVAEIGADVEFDGRATRRLEVGQARRQPTACKGRRHCDPQWCYHRLELPHRIGDAAQGFAESVRELGGCRGGYYAAPDAGKELLPQFRFQGADAQADGGRCQRQAVGSRGKAASLNADFKDAK